LKVILLKDNTASNGVKTLSGKKLLIGGIAAFVALPIVLGLATYWAVSTIDRSLNPFIDPEYRIAVESRVNEQKQEIVKTREYVRQHMDVLGRRIGSLQAQLTPLNYVLLKCLESV